VEARQVQKWVGSENGRKFSNEKTALYKSRSKKNEHVHDFAFIIAFFLFSGCKKALPRFECGRQYQLNPRTSARYRPASDTVCPDSAENDNASRTTWTGSSRAENDAAQRQLTMPGQAPVS
jgi:hypothetical protein